MKSYQLFAGALFILNHQPVLAQQGGDPLTLIQGDWVSSADAKESVLSIKDKSVVLKAPGTGPMGGVVPYTTVGAGAVVATITGTPEKIGTGYRWPAEVITTTNGISMNSRTACWVQVEHTDQKPDYFTLKICYDGVFLRRNGKD